MEEIAENMREGLLALAVGAGLQVMSPAEGSRRGRDVRSAGPARPGRTATRHGTEAGSVTLGGRRVLVARPRIRSTQGAGELPVPAYDLFNGTELLGKKAIERMLAGGLALTRSFGAGRA